VEPIGRFRFLVKLRGSDSGLVAQNGYLKSKVGGLRVGYSLYNVGVL
jgi:hypothetical protein